ncbi:hypothetical protein [Streptomyces sp. MZ04]|uniref:hypothetical protein n=1 Tax=Streptomyces sp. MZ04 TaxID=2559236 RepID=UPI00107EBC45|nr:hypothetical protein [Streptomyces sp. MZ04]TGB03228.1 hypothetical protein E2651_25715 [Streptomyces sp. MZ04]
MTDHGRAARFSYPDPIGSVLDVDLDDGRRLRVHLDGQVRPSWGDGIPILGADVPLEPGALSRCQYVYRVRLESDGTNRRVWIGTESLAHATEWTSLADCEWGTDGLVTEAAVRILQSTPPTAPSRTQPIPEAVMRLIRGLETAQRSGTVEHVRRLCEGSGAFLESLEPYARAEAQQALDEALTWLDGHAGYQQGVFADLQRAVDEGRAWDVREHYNRATALTRRGASAAEQEVLQHARAFLQEKNHRPAPDTAARRQRALNRLAPAQTRVGVTPRHRTVSAEERERIQQQAAVLKVRRLVSDLQRPNVSAGRRAKKLRELEAAVGRAKGALPWSDMQQVRALRKEQPADRPARPRPAPRQHQALSDEALASAAAAVRGALKRTARTQQTITWAELKEQLGSALPRISEEERRQLVVRVDETSERDEPLLSSILAAGDPQLAEAYRLSANLLGGQLPAGDRELLRDVIDADVRQTHAYWRHR